MHRGHFLPHVQYGIVSPESLRGAAIRIFTASHVHFILTTHNQTVFTIKKESKKKLPFNFAKSFFVLFGKEGVPKEFFEVAKYLTAKGRQANCFQILVQGSQYSTDLKTTLSSSPPTETITCAVPALRRGVNLAECSKSGLRSGNK